MKIAFNWAHLLFELSHEENSIRMAEKTALEVASVGGVVVKCTVKNSISKLD